VHILIDSGSYHCLNVGDVAMLQVGVERLRSLWPDASIAAVTNAPETLALHCAGVQPVPLVGRIAFHSDRMFGRADRFFSRSMREMLGRVQEYVRRDWPSGLGALISAKRAVTLRQDFTAPRAYVNAVKRADLVVATGAGVFADAFVDNAMGVLATLEFALQQHIPTALLAHGIGPVSDAALKRQMAGVLPRLTLMTLREHRESMRLIKSLGVAPDRVVVTGDDAIELANRQARPQLGDAIGVNVRVAAYSGVGGSAIDVIRLAVHRAAGLLAAPLVPVPIAHHPNCHDGVALQTVLAGSNNAPAPFVELNTPAKAVEQVSRCRVVVTGSYHAAVFALAQGIPVVALSATPYYDHKFTGLGEMFPGGCEMVALNGADSAVALESAIGRAWANAPLLREALLRHARRQIDAARAAYRRLARLVSVARPAALVDATLHAESASGRRTPERNPAWRSSTWPS
jgi:polysaccharide pyruvyl transferase WcaK-like protein